MQVEARRASVLAIRGDVGRQMRFVGRLAVKTHVVVDAVGASGGRKTLQVGVDMRQPVDKRGQHLRKVVGGLQVAVAMRLKPIAMVVLAQVR